MPAQGAPVDDIDMHMDSLEQQHKLVDHLMGKRVRVCNLHSKAELNGRTGLVASYDKQKERFRVRLDSDTIDGLATIMAFKAINLMPILQP